MNPSTSKIGFESRRPPQSRFKFPRVWHLAYFSIYVFSSVGPQLAAQTIAPPMVLHSFSPPIRPVNLGTGPWTGLTLGSDGAMWGTTVAGGDYDKGTIFRFTLSNEFNVRASFAGTNGASPVAPLALGTNGMLYGIATGGNNPVSGVVFRLGPNTIQALVDFGNLAPSTLSTSYDPRALILNTNDGSFYGVCGKGGFVGSVTSSGSVFAMSHAGAIRLVRNFLDDSFGYGPNSLVLGKDGLLYGATGGGGSNGVGMVFRMTTAGAISQVCQFSSSVSGESPRLYLQGSDGALYGNTFLGPGSRPSLFKLTTNGVLTILGEVDEGPFGFEHVVAGMIQTPVGIYGVTTGGLGNAGSIFRIGTDGKVLVLHRFQLSSVNGTSPRGLMLAPDGLIYGTTAGGGAAGNGTIFRTGAYLPQMTVGKSTGLPTISWAGISGLTYQVLVSSNIMGSNWLTLTNVLATNAAPSFIDRSATNSPTGFYRLSVP